MTMDMDDAVTGNDSMFDKNVYPMLHGFVDPLRAPNREIVGREHEQLQIRAALERPELSNVLLLAPAGAGKTALVQSTMLVDTERMYLEVDLSRMIANLSNADEMASRLKSLFDETIAYTKVVGREIVLFIDEAHQVVQLSAAAVEALKPILAASGTLGIRVIMATTFEEYNEFIKPNQPLDQRLQRILLTPPDSETTVQILRGMAERYDVSNLFPDDRLFREMYDLTERYQPADVQPRKSIKLLDAMVGWHRVTGKPMSMSLLADVLKLSTGIDVAFSVDGVAIKNNLDKRVFAQDMASSVIARRLQLCVADLHDKKKPNASFLFAGSTGVGKWCTNDTMVPVWRDDDVRWVRHGDLVAGDQVFARDGSVQSVVDVFPQGRQRVYRVHLADGRHLDVGGPHLWGVYTVARRERVHRGENLQPDVMSTLDMLNAGVTRPGSDGRNVVKFYIPAAGAVAWPESSLDDDPYTVGYEVGVQRSGDRSVPQEYVTGSIEQRWSLVRGLFDALGTIDPSGQRYRLSLTTASETLAEQTRTLLFSLGVSTSLSVRRIGDTERVEYDLHVRVAHEDKAQFFSVEEKKSIAAAAADVTNDRQHYYDMIGIVDIEDLGVDAEASCIYVDGDEHLYQAGEFVVTHNTEMTKALAELLFGDDTGRLIRFDMSEFALDDSLSLFRSELSQQVSNMGHAILLFDEVEKASPKVIRVLLQVLDDGRLTDDNGRQVSFLNTYIILTTNAGSEIFKTIGAYAGSDVGDGSTMDDFLKNIETSIRDTAGFPPELLGRIDEIVPFQPLSQKTLERIVISKLKQLRDEVKLRHNINVAIDERVIKYVSIDKIDTGTDSGGARNAVRTMQREVATEVATYINANPETDSIVVYVDGEMRAENKNRLKSGAKVKVDRNIGRRRGTN